MNDLGQSMSGYSLRTLSLPMRTLFSAFLVSIGIGYITALSYMYLVDMVPHRDMGMSMIEGITHKYRGSRGNTHLELSVRGAMGANLTPLEKELILRWVAEGAGAEGYKKIDNIVQKNCATCHNGTVPIPPMRNFEETAKMAQFEPGPSWEQLSRVSHVHLFGISFIFLLTGGIFALSESPVTLKAVVLAAPYVAIWLDIGSWWITHWEPFFAYVVVGGGALMGLALAAQILISLWEMWLKRPRPAAATSGTA